MRAGEAHYSLSLLAISSGVWNPINCIVKKVYIKSTVKLLKHTCIRTNWITNVRIEAWILLKNLNNSLKKHSKCQFLSPDIIIIQKLGEIDWCLRIFPFKPG